MKNELTKQPSELLDFGPCDVCGAPANTLTYDGTVTVRMDDDFDHPAKVESRVERRFCETHRRPGMLTFQRETAEAYFAHLRATEDADL